MKPKSFEQKLKWNMYTMGVLFFIFLAVSLLAKMGVYPESPFFFPWIQRRHLFRRPACPHGYTPA